MCSCTVCATLDLISPEHNRELCFFNHHVTVAQYQQTTSPQLYAAQGETNHHTAIPTRFRFYVSCASTLRRVKTHSMWGAFKIACMCACAHHKCMFCPVYFCADNAWGRPKLVLQLLLGIHPDLQHVTKMFFFFFKIHSQSSSPNPHTPLRPDTLKWEFCRVSHFDNRGNLCHQQAAPLPGCCVVISAEAAAAQSVSQSVGLGTGAHAGVGGVSYNSRPRGK